MEVLDAATPEICRYWMQQAAQLKVIARKYVGAGCNLNPEKHLKSKLLNSKSPALSLILYLSLKNRKD
jgi:hypothetical protein